MTYTFRALMCTFLLAGCAQETVTQTVYLKPDLPDIPQHCDLAQKPTPSEPRLKDGDATDVDAARDRVALKQAYRATKAYRSACYDELRAVLPKDSKKPTS
jgi:hypothetical protein